MEQVHEHKFFRELLDDYNQSFYDKDIDKLKEFYDIETNRLIYLDNHSGNDTYCLDDHLHLISEFFQNGKTTESGGVEPLIIEDFNVFHKTDSACLCFMARYQSHPVPGVRMTMYLEFRNEQWKVMHVHCSFELEK